ncbi:MAG TPA: hypothetical protein VFX92_07025 [Candidatus Krumholzibacteria bacterium]|nr:hypothetical protein [Candidatus Krumholzibacteria bacterium]
MKNWKLVLPLCLLGPLMGALMVMGVFPEGSDRFAWSAVIGLTAYLCARYEREHALLHGAVIGFWNGASATLVQALFLDTMAKNNPYVIEKFASKPAGFDLEYFVFMLVPFIGVTGGGMTGLLAMLAARVMSFREQAASPRKGNHP